MHDRRDAGHAHAKDGEAVGVCRPPLQSGLATIRDVVYAGGQIGAVRVFAMTGGRCRIGGLLAVERVCVGQRSSRGRRRWIGHGTG